MASTRTIAAVAAWVAVMGMSGSAAAAQDAMTYQKPPRAIEEVLDAPVTPVARVSPDRTMLLIGQPPTFPTIADVAQPRFRLAGLRFNPATNGPSREPYYDGMTLQPVEGGAARTIQGLPGKLKAWSVQWSPDSRWVAFQQRAADGLELWVIDVAAGSAQRLGGVKLNAVLGRPFEWLPDSSGLLCKVVPEGRGEAPKTSDVPTGPHISENLGHTSPAPTYEDMLKTPEDEAIFEFYATAQLAVVPLHGPVRRLERTGLIDTASPSPNGEFALVQEIHRPFSYTFTVDSFPEKTEVLTLKTGAVKVLFDRPLVDYLPIANDAVQVGPREYDWRSDTPATVAWIEANDGGDPKKEVAVHDRLISLAAPFEGKGKVLLESPMRIRNVDWGTDALAIASEFRWTDRQTRLIAFSAAGNGALPVTLYEGSAQDRYHSPGSPVTRPNKDGKAVLQLTPDGKAVYFFVPGASTTGDKPFVATMPSGGGVQTMLWRSADPYYAVPVALLSDSSVLIRRESETVSPNYFKVGLSASASAAEPVAITSFPSPFGGIKLPTKLLVKYKRADGVDLTATLWLPGGYEKSQGPLPTLMEAYPSEFKTRSAAGQVAGSPNRFPRITWGRRCSSRRPGMRCWRMRVFRSSAKARRSRTIRMWISLWPGRRRRSIMAHRWAWSIPGGWQ